MTRRPADVGIATLLMPGSGPSVARTDTHRAVASMVNPRERDAADFGNEVRRSSIPRLQVAGGRGYYLTHEGVLLNQALINCALQFGYKRGFMPVHTPFFMRQVGAEAAGEGQGVRGRALRGPNPTKGPKRYGVGACTRMPSCARSGNDGRGKGRLQCVRVGATRVYGHV